MASHSEYRKEDVALTPRGWHVRSVTQGAHVVRIAFPPGSRMTGSGHVVQILHPRHENPGYCPSKTRMTNPAELVLMGANPMRRNPRSTFGMTAREAEREVGKHDRIAARLAKKYPHFAIRWHTGNISQAFRSHDEAERILRRFHGAGEIIRINPMPASRERYRNPATAEAAREIREGFVDHESHSYRVANEPHIPLGDYAELGTSGYVEDSDTGERAEAYLAVKPAKGGYRLQIMLVRRGVAFLSDTTRRQIWIGGRYEMPEREIAQFANDRDDPITLGECFGIGYIAVKYHPQIDNHAAGRRILWEHEFGEEDGNRPRLVYHAGIARLSLEGGNYRVTDAGIVN